MVLAQQRLQPGLQATVQAWLGLVEELDVELEEGSCRYK
jgi:hypothetical protein